MFVYIITTKSNSPLYIGVTNDIHRRITEHRSGVNDSFSKKYSIFELVYCEKHDDPNNAISREKQLKGWIRKKKEQLIESLNPNCDDLSENYNSTDKEQK